MVDSFIDDFWLDLVTTLKTSTLMKTTVTHYNNFISLSTKSDNQKVGGGEKMTNMLFKCVGGQECKIN